MTVRLHRVCVILAASCCVLVGCATHPAVHATSYRSPSAFQPARRYAPPPGPASDPWGPFIIDAASRFAVPETWIRAIMQQESGGAQFQDGVPTTSPIGAMGLMQVMLDTYEVLRGRYGLGADPYEPHDNILAGTAYIRELYDAYGFPSFIAAYNAGPRMVDACLGMGTPLPEETVSYLMTVAPKLRPYAPLSGPLAPYAYAPVEMSADELNRRGASGQPLPIASAAAAPALPCVPPASDHGADDLNRQMLAQGSG